MMTLHSDRPIDRLTVEKIEVLRKEALDKDMDIDWERARLIPYPTDTPRTTNYLPAEEGDYLPVDHGGVKDGRIQENNYEPI